MIDQECIDLLGFDPREHDPLEAEAFLLGKDSDAKFKEIKKKYKVGELKAILKKGGVKGYSRLKEDQLIKLIIDNNLL